MNKEFEKLFNGLKDSKQELLHLDSKVLLIDSMNTFLRSFIMIKHLNPHGHHIGGLTGYLKSIGYVIRLIKPTRVILVFDGLGGSTAKRNLFPEYKANRKLTRVTNWDGFDNKDEESESITNQIVRLIDYLKCLPVDLLIVEKVEADDVIGYLTQKLEEEVYIVSTDNDYLQLVNNRVTLYSPIKKKFYTPDAVKEIAGISPANFLNYKVLAGDTSDNIPGVRGLQAKKILKLFPEFKEDTRYDFSYVIEKSKELRENHKLYGSILSFQKQLEINNILMNLHEPLISDLNIDQIHDLLLNPQQSYNPATFLKMYNEDMLGGSIINPQMWMHDTFSYLKAFKKKLENSNL